MADAINTPRRMVRRRVAAALVLALVMSGLVGAPDADAFLGIPGPAELIGGGVQGMLDVVLKTLFGGIPSTVTEAAVAWQLHLPSAAFTDSNVTELKDTTTAAAFALLGLVATASMLRYWLSGLTDAGGGGEAMTGLIRTVGAALGIVAWPWFFASAVSVTNQLTHSLVYAGSVDDDLSRMIGAAVGVSVVGGPVGTLAAIVLVVAGTLLMLGLFALHIAMACALVVLFVGGPLLIVLTPFPGTAWMCHLALRAFVTLLAWPVIWAVCFAAFAAVFADFVSFKGDGGLLDKALIAPLTGVAMLYLCVKLPLVATRASMIGVGGQGFVGFAGRVIAVRQLERGITSRLGGGPATPPKTDPLHSPGGHDQGIPAGTGTGAVAADQVAPAPVTPAVPTPTAGGLAVPLAGAGGAGAPPEPVYSGQVAGGEGRAAHVARLAGAMHGDAAKLAAGDGPRAHDVSQALRRLGDQAGRMRVAAAHGNLASAAFTNAADAQLRGDEPSAAAYRTIGQAAVGNPTDTELAVHAHEHDAPPVTGGPETSWPSIGDVPSSVPTPPQPPASPHRAAPHASPHRPPPPSPHRPAPPPSPHLPPAPPQSGNGSVTPSPHRPS